MEPADQLVLRLVRILFLKASYQFQCVTHRSGHCSPHPFFSANDVTPNHLSQEARPQAHWTAGLLSRSRGIGAMELHHRLPIGSPVPWKNALYSGHQVQQLSADGNSQLTVPWRSRRGALCTQDILPRSCEGVLELGSNSQLGSSFALPIWIRVASKIIKLGMPCLGGWASPIPPEVLG